MTVSVDVASRKRTVDSARDATNACHLSYFIGKFKNHSDCFLYSCLMDHGKHNFYARTLYLHTIYNGCDYNFSEEFRCDQYLRPINRPIKRLQINRTAMLS